MKYNKMKNWIEKKFVEIKTFFCIRDVKFISWFVLFVQHLVSLVNDHAAPVV